MKIIDIGAWWKSLCKTIYSILVSLVTEENPEIIIHGPQNEMCLTDEPEMADAETARFTPVNEESNHKHEPECYPMFDTDDSADTSASHSVDSSVMEPIHVGTPILSSVSKSSSQTQIPQAFITAVSQSTLGGESVSELGTSALHDTSNEREIISNMLKKLIENIEPTLTPDFSSRPVTTRPSSSRNTAAINLGYCCYKVVEDVAKELGMKISAHDKYWDVIWYSRPITATRCAAFSKQQRANYFPESQRAVWKNNLALCLTKMWKIFPNEYDFFPKSWSLPRDWHLMEKYARKHPKDWFIVKPNNWGCGYGIFLTSEVTKLSNCGKMTSQVYIRKPFLIDDLKFDLRIYVLVTSCKPLRIFVFNEGLARFTTEKYQEPDHQNKTNRYMHLTNYAVNKYSPTYFIDETKGTLRRWTTVSEWLIEHEIDAKNISATMDDVIIKTLIAMTPTLKYHYFKSFPDQADSNSCFQIFGFDIMFGSDLKVYVLEVNGSPQFYADVTLDIEMTKDLIHDTFNILNLAEKPGDTRPSTRTKNMWIAKQRDSRTITQHRTEWENSHLGNFRKIYPNERNKHYKKFMRAAEHFIHPL